MAIYARWQQQVGISLEEMQEFWSSNWHGGYQGRELPGLCATQDAEYLAELIIRTVCRDDDGKLYSRFRTKKALGEIVIFEGDDTGAQCMDHQPVVHPTRIIARIPVAEFLSWAYLKASDSERIVWDSAQRDWVEAIDYHGPRFADVQSFLKEEVTC